MKCVVSVSGGVPSAIALERAIQKFGRENTCALFADTKTEDSDLYRFLLDIERHFEHPITRISEGRNVWEVFNDNKMMGSTRVDLCSRILKRDLIRKWIESRYSPSNTVLAFGFGYHEMGRIQRLAERMLPYTVWCPLHESPFLSPQECIQYVQDEWDIDPPKLYEEGFKHNNCGGACVKAGHGQWFQLYKKRPETYSEWERNEQEFRSKTGKDVAILRDRRGKQTKPMTLRELRLRFTEEGYRPSDLNEACDCMGLRQ